MILKKVFLVLILATITAPLSFSQTATVTGHELQPDGTPPATGKVCFTLQGYSPNVPKISGVAVIIAERNFCISASAVDGSYSTSLYQNSAITPAGTYWRVDFMVYGRQQSSANYTINSASFNLDSAAANTIPPTVPAPTGDSTYLRLDGGNQPTGSIVPAANGSQALGATGARWNAFLNSLTVTSCAGCGTGTVTSAALTVPAWLSVSGSPITGAGTFAVTAASGQTSHQVIGTCGTATSFAPCALVNTDLAGAVFGASGASHNAGAVPDPGASAGTSKFLREDATWATPPASGVSEATVTGSMVIAMSSLAGITEFHLTNAHTITRLTVWTETVGVTCGTLPQVNIQDQTTTTVLATVTMALSTSYTDSGALSVATTANHDFTINVSRAAVCTVGSFSNPHVTVNYQ